jgi:hypothetical protein
MEILFISIPHELSSEEISSSAKIATWWDFRFSLEKKSNDFPMLGQREACAVCGPSLCDRQYICFGDARVGIRINFSGNQRVLQMIVTGRAALNKTFESSPFQID